MVNKKNKYKSNHQNNQSASKIEIDEQQLTNQCLIMHQLLKNRTAKIRQLQDNQFCYILSTKWLREWKQYVGYDKITEDKQVEQSKKKDKKYGKRHPGKINIDIVAPSSEYNQCYKIPEEMKNYQYLNKLIAQKKTKDDDYIAITKDIWDNFLLFYEGEEIRRPVRRLKGSTYYDSEPLKLDTIFANLQEQGLEERIKKTSKKSYGSIFQDQKLLIPNLWTLKQLKQFLAQYCGLNYGCSKIHIWKGLSYLTTQVLSECLVQSVRDRKFLVRGRQLTLQKYQGKDMDDYLKNSHTLIIQIGDILKSDLSEQQNIKGYCQQCVTVKKLTIGCLCNQVIYCSQKCRIDDQSFHFKTCDRAFDSEDDEDLDKVQLADVPIAGFQNLGNTCYMNSVMQLLVSINHFRQFFIKNIYLNSLNQKQLKDNNCMMLRKLSKTFKALALEKDAYAPWSLKGQIDYNLTPFKGDKQHDANDYLINFLNLINDYLKKNGDKAYHSVLEPFIGEFFSKVVCPSCQIQSENTQIFMQISLPIKSKIKQQFYQYAVVKSPSQYVKGKAQLTDTWKDMKKDVEALDSLVFVLKEPEGMILVDQQQKSPAQIIKALRGQLLYYQNIKYLQGQQIFVFTLITIKNVVGSKLKSPYGLPVPVIVDCLRMNLFTFWLKIIRSFFSENNDIVDQANKLQMDYLQWIENNIKNETKVKQQESTKQSKNEDQKQQLDEQNKIIQQFNSKIKLLIQKIGIEVFIYDIKRHKNICKFCNKKCSGCELSQSFGIELSDYFKDTISQIKFQVYLRDKIDIEITQLDRGSTADPSIHDCFALFNQPEQLDQQNAWYCQNCDSMTLALKELQIKTYPFLLIIHLNRFKNLDGKKMKNSDPIQYKSLQIFGQYEYRLIGVVIHEGSMDAGHYWSIALREDKYYIFNDSKVSPVDKVFNRNAYILLYQRIDFIC